MRYYVDDYGGGPDDYYRFNTQWQHPQHLDYAAEEAAEDYCKNHGGLESQWPLTFVLMDDQGKELGCFVVELKAVSQFYVARLQEEL